MKKVDKSETATLSQRTGDLIIAKKELAYQTKVELIKELKKLYQEYDSLKTSYEKDITRHKRTEENLHESAMKLARSQKIGKLGCWEWNMVDNSLEWSDEVYQIWGVGKDFALSFESINQMIHPDDREFNLKMVQKFLADTNNGEFEFRIICPDGTIKNIFQSIETSHAPSGQPLRMFGIMQDITDRKLAEEALHMSEEKYRSLIEQSTDGLVISDEHGNIALWNKGTESITGLHACDTIGAPLWKVQAQLIPDEIKTPELLEQLRTGMENIIKSKIDWQGESREQTIICADGKRKTVQDSSFIIKTNNTVRIGTILRDITERKQAENNLKRFQLLSQNSRDIILFIRKRDLKILDANEAALKAYGYSREELMRKSVIDLRHPETVKDLRVQVNNANTEGLLFETIHCRRDGKSFPVEVSSCGMTLDEDRILLSIVRDITDRKLAEIKIEKSKELLTNLNKRMESVRENERADISREIHDQLGQSLTALKIDLMSLQAKMETEPKEGAVLGNMIKMVNAISRDVQRISSELRPLMLDDLGLAATLEWYCEEFAGRTGLKVESDIEAIQSDSIDKDLALYRVAQESFTNIIRHANAGMVQVSLHIINDNLVLTIHDDGIGISKDKTESYKSLGLLGMSERVKQYEGKLEILAPDKNGTIIRASIPIN